MPVFDVGDDVNLGRFRLNKAGLSLACVVCMSECVPRLLCCCGELRRREKRKRTWMKEEKIMRTQQNVVHALLGSGCLYKRGR